MIAAKRIAAKRFAALALLGMCSALGCGSGDAEADGGDADAPLCTPERDPSGLQCSGKRLGSLGALAIVRQRVSGARLIRARSDASGTLNVDGLDSRWEFTFEDPAGGPSTIASTLGVDFGGATEFPPDDPPCGASAEIRALDSELVVPEAVRRLEMRAGLFHGSLHLMQEGCAPGRPEQHALQLTYFDETLHYFARYWDDGTFIELVGPCRLDLESCLDGETP